MKYPLSIILLSIFTVACNNSEIDTLLKTSEKFLKTSIWPVFMAFLRKLGKKNTRFTQFEPRSLGEAQHL